MAKQFVILTRKQLNELIERESKKKLVNNFEALQCSLMLMDCFGGGLSVVEVLALLEMVIKDLKKELKDD